MKRHLMETQKLKDNYYKAGMLQKDGKEIDVIDLALLKRVLMGTTNICIWCYENNQITIEKCK